MRANPSDAVYAKARAVVVAWLDGELHASDAAHVPSDAAAQLVDTVAWTIQDALDAEHARVAALEGALTPAMRLAHEVVVELQKAQRKHASMHSGHEGYAVILEELDELWDEVRAWQPGSDMSKARKEAIQVAAMALRFIVDVCDRALLPEARE